MLKIEGDGWTAWLDDENGVYTAETSVPGAYNLYQINAEMFEKLLADGPSNEEKYQLIHTGRHLYMSVNDRCGPPYDIVFDEDYGKICPWAKVISNGKVWSSELTDAAVEIFESEKQNRDQRRKKREQRERAESDLGSGHGG